MAKKKNPAPVGDWRRGGDGAALPGSASLIAQSFLVCPAAQRQNRLGAAFRALPEDDQRRHAMRVIERADELGRRKTLRLSVLIDRNNPPDLEYHRQKKNIRTVAFADRERAIEWIIQAYGFGLDVHHGIGVGSDLGHPCEAEGETI